MSHIEVITPKGCEMLLLRFKLFAVILILVQ